MKWGVVLGMCALVACRNEDAARTEASSQARSPTPSSAAPASSARAAASATATSSAGPETASGTLTKEAFCERAAQIGDKNMEACAPALRANVPAMDSVKDVAAAKKECSMRVASPKVEFRPDVAHRCIAAAEKRGGKTTFFSFHLIPECNGVLGGKAVGGEPAIFAEECAPGFSFLKNRCAKPVAKNGTCEDYPGGQLGRPDEHPRCEEGLGCYMTRYSADGYPAEFACLPPQPIDARCKLGLDQCVTGSSCYQGKCRARAEAGAQCMAPGDCVAGHTCEIKGGVFGTCVVQPEVPLETCGAAAK